jgi:hypothetical protein
MKAFASISKRKRWLIIASLCFVSNPLLANEGWVESEYTSKFSAYVDTKSIMREKEFAVVRILKNYVMPQTEDEMQAFRSVVTLTLYECEKQVFNILTMQFYELAWAKGTLIESYDLKKQSTDDNEWSPVNPGTIQDAFMEYACDGMPAMPITKVRYLGLLGK